MRWHNALISPVLICCSGSATPLDGAIADAGGATDSQGADRSLGGDDGIPGCPLTGDYLAPGHNRPLYRFDPDGSYRALLSGDLLALDRAPVQARYRRTIDHIFLTNVIASPTCPAGAVADVPYSFSADCMYLVVESGVRPCDDLAFILPGAGVFNSRSRY